MTAIAPSAGPAPAASSMCVAIVTAVLLFVAYEVTAASAAFTLARLPLMVHTPVAGV